MVFAAGSLAVFSGFAADFFGAGVAITLLAGLVADFTGAGAFGAAFAGALLAGLLATFAGALVGVFAVVLTAAFAAGFVTDFAGVFAADLLLDFAAVGFDAGLLLDLVVFVAGAFFALAAAAGRLAVEPTPLLRAVLSDGDALLDFLLIGMLED